MMKTLLFFSLIIPVSVLSMEVDSEAKRSEKRQQIQHCIQNISSDLNQTQQIKIISQCLFEEAHAQIAAEQLLLSTTAHKNGATNPLRNTKGPRTSKGFGYHLYPIGFAVNIDPAKTYFDLIIVNWYREVPDFFQTLFAIDGKPCYMVSDLPVSEVFLKENDDCFSYLSKRRFEKDAAVLSPKIKALWKLLGNDFSSHDFPIFRQGMLGLTKLDSATLYLHETYHVHQHNNVNDQGYTAHKSDMFQMASAIDQYLRSEEEQKLLYAYGLLVLKITQPELLSVSMDKKAYWAMLRSLIDKIRSTNKLLWDRFIHFEYDEGMAEFFAIQTVLDSQFVDSVDIHDNQLLGCNEMFYKTGALGMHLLVGVLDDKLWPENPAIPSEGVWEKILRLFQIECDDEKLEEFLKALKDHEKIRAETVKMAKFFTSDLPVTANLAPLSNDIVSGGGLSLQHKRVYSSPDGFTTVILVGNRAHALPSFTDKFRLSELTTGRLRTREGWETTKTIEYAFSCDSLDGVGDSLIESGYVLISDEEVIRPMKEKFSMAAPGQGSLDITVRILCGQPINLTAK